LTSVLFYKMWTFEIIENIDRFFKNFNLEYWQLLNLFLPDFLWKLMINFQFFY
jgi:hypothetical protein